MTTPTASSLIVIDSSGWLEFITAGTKADLFVPYFADDSIIVVPTIVLYEVRRVLLIRQTKTLADAFVSQALALKLIAVDHEIALAAAAASIQTKLSIGDALIYECAQSCHAELITSDSHFQGLPNVALI